MLDIDFLLEKKRRETIEAAKQPMPTLPVGDNRNVKYKVGSKPILRISHTRKN